VTSRDGTVIGYRQAGRGLGVIVLHGGMQTAQNFMMLAGALADSFTVYVPDRRERGLSGPPGDHYGLGAECEDVAALAQVTGARSLFGLSLGAIIALQAALVLPMIRRVAVYEPPLSVNHSTPTHGVSRYDREVAQGKLDSAEAQDLPCLKQRHPNSGLRQRRDCALIFAGGRSRKVRGSYDPGLACDDLLAGRVRGCLGRPPG
jgi:pimeloyl-ACP methyl ester carboxylesterase